MSDLRDRLAEELGWLGPDMEQGIESAMRAIEGDGDE